LRLMFFLSLVEGVQVCNFVKPYRVVLRSLNGDGIGTDP